MALQGTFYKIEKGYSETEYTEIQIQHPDGRIAMAREYNQEEKITPIFNAYVIVRAASVHQRMSVEGYKTRNVSVILSVYKNKNAKNKDFFNELYHEVIDLPLDSLDDLTPFDNPVSYAYTKLKNYRQTKDLTLA